MSWRIEIKPSAEKQYLRLDATTRRRIKAALRELEGDGWFILPASKKPGAGKQIGPRRLGQAVARPSALTEDAGKIKQLKLIQVGTEQQKRLWNELMIQDHPQGERPLVGRQLRYLVQSEHGWLGGVGFSAAALHLEARDRWIGWDWKARQEGPGPWDPPCCCPRRCTYFP